MNFFGCCGVFVENGEQAGGTNHNMCYTLRIQRVNAVRAAFRESILPFSSPFASNITSIYEQFSFASRRRSFRLFAPDCLGCP